jgi:pSer/pThr/pTyr-binding forkhead associated (FHA) protein
MPQGETVVGRFADCDLPIPDASISRRHARLTVTGRNVTIEDLGSKNGTRVNGVRLQEPFPLSSPASVQFGTVTAKFCIEESADTSTLTVHSGKIEHLTD